MGAHLTLLEKEQSTWIWSRQIEQGNKESVCALKNVLYVPELAYNLVSVPRVAEAWKIVHFCNSMTGFRNEKGASKFSFGAKRGSLYSLNFSRNVQETLNMGWREKKVRLYKPRVVWTPQWAQYAEAADKTCQLPGLLHHRKSWSLWSLH